MPEKEFEVVTLPKVQDPRGNLSYVEGGPTLPFEIARCYWIYDVPGGKVRHDRALKRTTEMIVALSGSFDVSLTTVSGDKHTVHLCRSYEGLVIYPGCSREINNFSTNSVAMVLADTLYDPDDYMLSEEARTL